jgi:hypothetical protein
MGLRDWLEEWFGRRRAMDGAPTFCCTASSVQLGSMEDEIEEAVAAGQVPLTADGTFVRDGRAYDLGLLKEERLKAAQAIGEAVEATGVDDSQATASVDMEALEDEVSDDELVNPHGVIAGEEAERAAEARAAADTVATTSHHDADWRLDDSREPDLTDDQAGLVEDERRRRMSMSDAPIA